MSIKIYEAWRYKGTLQTLLPKLTAFMKQALPIQMKTVDTQLARLLCLSRDGKGEAPIESVSTFIHDLIRAQMKAENSPGSFDGPLHQKMTWSAVCFPTGKHVLVLFYGPRELREPFVQALEIEPYGYWDSTDRPDEVTAREWRTRAKVWDKALIGDSLTGIPVDAGYLYAPAFPWGQVGLIRGLLDNQPPLEDRAASILLDEMFEAAPKKKEDYFRIVGDLDNLIQAARKDLEAHPEIYRRLKEIEGTVKPLTKEDLMS